MAAIDPLTAGAVLLATAATVIASQAVITGALCVDHFPAPSARRSAGGSRAGVVREVYTPSLRAPAKQSIVPHKRKNGLLRRYRSSQ